MPHQIACARCGKIGLVRFENVVRAQTAERHFYCGACNYAWAVTDDGRTKANRGYPPERSRADKPEPRHS